MGGNSRSVLDDSKKIDNSKSKFKNKTKKI
jgi:hypothetical protein